MLARLKDKFIPKKINFNLGTPVTHLTGRTGLKLNLGCSGDIRAGYVNIDADPNAFGNAPAGAECMVFYLGRDPLPIADHSCDFIYSSHFFEHIEYHELKNLLQECFRVLKPGGELRTAMPLFDKLAKVYVEKDQAFFDWMVNDRTVPEFRMPKEEIKWADIMSLGLFEWGAHKYFYDVEKIIDMFQRAEFIDVKETAYDASVDIDYRFGHSFYVTGKKP